MKTYCLIRDNQCIEVRQFEEPPKLSANKPQWKELVDEGTPSITDNQVVESSAGLVDDKWVISYAVRNKTPFELWHDKDSALRIKISLAQINSSQQLQGFVSQLILWWNLMKFRREVDTEYAYFYCNQILPEHQNIVNNYSGLITIENIPLQ